MKLRLALFATLLVILSSLGSADAAVTPGETLDDPALEARARSLGKELRCLVCQNQSIDDSDASLAKDLRNVVRERLLAGDDDQEIKDFLVDRYGAFVLLKPPVETSTYLLWAGPFLIFALGAAGVFMFMRKRTGEVVPVAALSDEERLKLERMTSSN